MLPSLTQHQERRIVAALLLSLFAALAWQAWWLSVTVDEPSHLLSAHLYWHGRDRLYPRDMPPLIKIVGGWPSRFMNIPLPPDLGKPGDTRLEWAEASDLIRRMGTDAPAKLQKFVFYCRLPMTLFPLLTVLVLWRWGRELFGPAAGLTVAALWAMCPVALGHGALFKNDHAATFTYLLFWWTAWRFWRHPQWRNLLWFAAAAGLVALGKNSMLFLLGIAPALVLLRRRNLAWTAVAVLIPWAILNVAYQFDWHWVTPVELAGMVGKPKSPPEWFLAAANVFRWIPIPENLWIGVVSLFASNAAAVPVYMLGQVYPDGNRWYFVLATLLKLEFTTLALFLGALVVLCRRRPAGSDAFWLLPGFLYFALASMSSLHLGARLVLPAWVFFTLIAGVTAERLLTTRNRRLVLAATLAGSFVLTASSYPGGLAYYNPFVGGKYHSLRYLADSNTDWGQSLRDLARFASSREIDKLRLAYFGFDIPQRFFPPGAVELLVPPWSERAVTSDRLKPEKGWYAISASLLPGHFFQPAYREYYSEFRHRHPVVVCGGSLFVYFID